MERIIHLYAIKSVYSRTNTRTTEEEKKVKTRRNTGDSKKRKRITSKTMVFVIPYDPFGSFTDTFFGPSSYLHELSD